jgi:hypothetical protein
LTNGIWLNKKPFHIPGSIFSKIMRNFEVNGLIKIGVLTDADIVEQFDSPQEFYSYVMDETKNNKYPDWDEITKFTQTYFEVISVEKVESEIRRLKKAGLSIDGLQAELNKQETLDAKKVKLYFSNDKGIFGTFNEKEIIYPIKGKRQKMIKLLKDGKKDLKILCKIQDQKDTLLMKEIIKINKNFRDKFKVKNDLIKNIPTGGYKLNDENYDIEFEE